MTLYRLQAIRTYIPLAFRTVPALSEATLIQALSGIVVHQLTATQSGYDLHLQLKRRSREDAVQEIVTVLLKLGFNVMEIEITEWATAAAEGALLGAAGGGTAGSATKDPWVALFGAVVGAIVGAAIGHAKQTLIARYRADQVAPGYWQVTQLELPAAEPQLGYPGIA